MAAALRHRRGLRRLLRRTGLTARGWVFSSFVAALTVMAACQMVLRG